ncbi:nuclear factor 7, brain-like [Pristis pectinata]|uniref:nuclear factor 7, brain-like n=1 Tax=Pristis pectinata TaxID=685728 RepID=UPI00223E5233|nr:nuclear factor 7, brain-like [Pristis pectinata]
MESLGRHVSEEFATMRRFLEEREHELQRDLADYAAGLLQPLEDNLRTIQRALISVQKDIIYCQAVVNQWDSRRFLQEFKWLKERPHEDIHCPAVVSAKPCLGVFKGPLRYRVWKEMRNCISPAPASLTLDPNTANAWLQLEEDLTGARAGETRQEVPDDPGRFDPSPCVLGSEGFGSGRHYWEVEVQDKTEWAVGVARETAPRKGDIALSPRDGFWSIWLRRGADYRALTSPPTRLAPDPRPDRVGVYLDYEGGQVSFYDADCMAHLFTFTAAFSERLYPFFSPGLREGRRNQTPVRVRHLRL